MFFWILGFLLFSIIAYICLWPWFKYRLYARKMPASVHIHPFVPIIGNALLYRITRGNITHI